MKKKASKKIIEENIKGVINEAPLDPVRSAIAGVKGVGSGVRGAFRGIGANYRLNVINSQFNQFADKVEKTWKIHEPKIRKNADKLSRSRDKTFKAMGNDVLLKLDEIETNVKNFSNGMRQASPGSFANTGQSGQSSEFDEESLKQMVSKLYGQPQAQEKQNLGFEDWAKNQGVDPNKLSKQGYLNLYNQYRIEKQAEEIQSQQKAPKSEPTPEPTPEPPKQAAPQPTPPQPKQPKQAQPAVDPFSSNLRKYNSAPKNPFGNQDLASVVKGAAADIAKQSRPVGFVDPLPQAPIKQGPAPDESGRPAIVPQPNPNVDVYAKTEPDMPSPGPAPAKQQKWQPEPRKTMPFGAQQEPPAAPIPLVKRKTSSQPQEPQQKWQPEPRKTMPFGIPQSPSTQQQASEPEDVMMVPRLDKKQLKTKRPSARAKRQLPPQSSAEPLSLQKAIKPKAKVKSSKKKQKKSK